MSLVGFLKGEHGHLFSRKACLLNILGPWVGVSWISGEGSLVVFKYSLPVSWLSQKCHFVNLITRSVGYQNIFLSALSFFFKSLLHQAFLQQSICVVKHQENIMKINHRAFCSLLVPSERQTWKYRLTCAISNDFSERHCSPHHTHQTHHGSNLLWLHPHQHEMKTNLFF